jgi:glucose 1-dehydrogenase
MSREARLAGRVAIVTGGGRGIGAALARGLAREGAAVVVNYSRSGAEARAVVAEILGCGGKATAVQADVSALAHHDRLVSAALDSFGKLDVLVNNAGIEYRQPFLTTTVEQWEQTVGVNLKGAYFLCQRAAAEMVKSGGGRIVNISSVHDTVPLAGRSAYAVSKGGLAMLTKALALELAEHRINVNAVSPGAILTEMNRSSLENPETRARLLARIPANRLGDVEDCVGAAVFLASPEADYLTGATLYVDGGLLLRRL